MSGMSLRQLRDKLNNAPSSVNLDQPAKVLVDGKEPAANVQDVTPTGEITAKTGPSTTG